MPGCLIIDAKGVYDAIHRNESAALSMSDKRSAVEGLALRESLGRTKTQLRWCHSEANVADGLTKADPRALQLLRKFLASSVWRIIWDPLFTSSKRLRSQARAKSAPKAKQARSTTLPTTESSEGLEADIAWLKASIAKMTAWLAAQGEAEPAAGDTAD